MLRTVELIVIAALSLLSTVTSALTNPEFQRFFREYSPPAILVWGKNDKVFPAEGAHAYREDLPDVEFHLFDTGHFALEDKLDEIGPLIRDFLDRKVARQVAKEGA